MHGTYVRNKTAGRYEEVYICLGSNELQLDAAVRKHLPESAVYDRESHDHDEVCQSAGQKNNARQERSWKSRPESLTVSVTITLLFLCRRGRLVSGRGNHRHAHLSHEKMLVGGGAVLH